MPVRSSCVHSTLLYGHFKGVSIIKKAWSLCNLTSYWLEVTRVAVLHVCPWILKIAT